MLLPALIAIATASQHVPFRLLMKTESQSPRAQEAILIQDRAKAYAYVGLVQKGMPRPWAMMKTNWRRSNYLAVYPGLVQRDAKISIKSINRGKNGLTVHLDLRQGISAMTYYPIFFVTIPKQPLKEQATIVDPDHL